MDIQEFKNFLDYLKQEKKKEINIIMHDNPDPDSMASAFGLSKIFDHFKIKSKIYYRGSISHPQNKTLVNVLGLKLERTNENLNSEDNICVDCTPNNSCVNTALMIIDHHKNPYESSFSMVNSYYGACATIIWNILKELELPETNELEDIALFTALLIGIRTDTNDLVSENITTDDFTAYQELLKLSDKEALQKVMNYPFPRYLYSTRIELHREGNSYENNGIFIGGIGYIPGEQRDTIAILAEEYMRMESINTAIIFAVVDKETLQISVRSSNVSLDVGSMCRDVFEGFGGGTSYKGGASIPIPFFKELENGDKEKFWDIIRKQMFKKILKEDWVAKVEVT